MDLEGVGTCTDTISARHPLELVLLQQEAPLLQHSVLQRRQCSLTFLPTGNVRAGNWVTENKFYFTFSTPVTTDNLVQIDRFLN